MTRIEKLRKALTDALLACSQIQIALDKGDVDTARDWLESLSIDATDALNDTVLEE